MKRFMRLPKFDEHLDLHRMDCLSSHCDLTSTTLRERRMEVSEEEMRPQLLLSGDDLIAMGHLPGPRFKGNSVVGRRRAAGRAIAQS